MVAAGLSVFLGTPWGPDVLLSGFVQGVAAEVVFGFTLYRLWSFPVLAVAAVASAAAAWIHDWVALLPHDRPDDPGHPPRVHGDLGGRHRGRWLGRAPSIAEARRRARRIPRLTGADRRAGELAARNLSISHRGSDRLALDGISFELPAGNTMLVVGPSGSGKSTLALAIGGMIPREIPAAMGGLLSLDGREIRGLEPAAVAARVGMVWQDPDSQLVMERVEDDVAFGLENRGWPRDAMRGAGPGSARRDGSGGPGAATVAPAVGRPAAAARPGRRAGAATGRPGARRAHREPRSGGRGGVHGAPGRAARASGRPPSS